VELRCGDPYTLDGFAAFNRVYYDVLAGMGLLVDGANPVARTNVAPALDPPDEQVLFAFSYVAPGPEDGVQTFVISGAGELRSGTVERAGIVRRGEQSPEAMGEKAACVAGAIGDRLEGLGCEWAQVTCVNVYTVYHLQACVERHLQDAMPPVRAAGVHWYPARPPVREIDFEMDARGVGDEVWI
jgi:hypothetical protein